MSDLIIKLFTFKKLSLDEKLKIKNHGRPTPNIDLIQTTTMNNKTYVRHFSKNYYNNFKWLTGCEVRNKLYCFPCLLFSSDDTENLWSYQGYTDLKHFGERARKHEKTICHLNCCTDLALLGTLTVTNSFDSAYQDHIKKHNEKVTQNRYILQRIINCMKFCGKLELPLGGYDSLNPGVFLELVERISSELDIMLKDNFYKNEAFKGTSTMIQNEILECMFAVCQEEIKKQIAESKFLSIQCDDTSDISNHSQMVFIVRYMYDGKIHERFWTYINVEDKSVAGLTKSIESELVKLISCPLKLIAQAYDGASVMSGSKNGVQAKIKEKYPNAHFVHCYAHQPNLLMQKGLSINAKIRVFFANLSAIPAFFSSSTHRGDMMKKVVEQRLPEVCQTGWNYNIHTVNVVHANRENLILCFKELENSDNVMTCREASSLRKHLEDPDFQFYLTLFHKILPYVDILFQQFQSINKTSPDFRSDIAEFENRINAIENTTDESTNKTSLDFPCDISECESSINDIRNTTDEWIQIGDDLEQNIDDAEIPSKRTRLDSEDVNYRPSKQICDTIISQIKDRLEYRGHLEAASLLCSKNFVKNLKCFPAIFLENMPKFYPQVNIDQLKIEIGVLYSRRDIRKNQTFFNMFSWFNVNNLSETFPETVKLLQIILTTPLSAVEPETQFSTLDRIKAVHKNTMSEDSLNLFTMLSVHQLLFLDVDHFDNKVIDKFVEKKDRHMDFIFKK